MVETSPKYVMLFVSARWVSVSVARLWMKMKRAKRRGRKLYALTFLCPRPTGQLCRRRHRLAVEGGLRGHALLPASTDEPAYRIRNAEQAYDRIVCEHELSETYGQTRTSRTRSLD